MSMVTPYLKQTAGLKRYLRSTDTGRAEYAETVEIPCRVQADRRLVRDEKGNQVVSESALYCDERVGPKDVLVVDEREYPVIRTATKVDLDGRYDHTEVRL